MNKKKLLERQKFVTGKPLPNRVTSSIFSRRTGNYTVMETQEDGSFDNSFFDFEDELSGMKSAAEQFAETFKEEPFLMEEREEQIVEPKYNPAPLMLEEIEEQEEVSSPPPSFSENDPENEDLDMYQMPTEPFESSSIELSEKPKFEFVQCSYHKEDGTQCKRQAPKGKTICASHQKLIDKQSR